MKWIFFSLSRKIQNSASFIRNQSKNEITSSKTQPDTKPEERGDAKIERDEINHGHDNDGFADDIEEIRCVIVNDGVVMKLNQSTAVGVHDTRINDLDHRNCELIIKSSYDHERAAFTDDTVYLNEGPTNKVYTGAAS